MTENDLDEIVAVVCDGYGYGSDGEAWGGEILHCTRDGYFERLGHLGEQPMIGGDLATRYPLRMAAGMLSKEEDVEEWLLSKSSDLPHGRQEAEVILQQLGKGSTPKTSSCGRVLDAAAAILGICYERTYEGEAAMKLEAVAIGGRDALKLKPVIEGETLNTTMLIHQIFARKNTIPVRDLAFSAQQYLAQGLAQIAAAEAERQGIKVVGFSGGVAHNEHINVAMKKAVEGRRLRFVAHQSVPAGDGGLSFGQSVAAAQRMEH